MKINLQNYEEYFVRYIDDDLSEGEAAEVSFFLAQYPELKSDFEAYISTIIHPDTSLAFPAKQLLKQSVHQHNFDDYFCRYAENDLAQDEIDSVDSFLLQNPSYQKHLNAYMATKLVADISLVYPDKHLLKKKEDTKVIPIGARYIMSAVIAASLVLIVMLKGLPWFSGNLTAPVADTDSAQHETLVEAIDDVMEPPHDVALFESKKELNEVQKKAVARRTSQKELKEKTSDNLIGATEMNPLQVSSPELLPAIRNSVRAPYLVPVYEEVVSGDAIASNGFSNQVGSFLSIASVVGSEILKLSGRGDLVKSPDADQQIKTKEPFSISIQSKRFAFYHKFINKEKSSSKK